MKTLFLIFTFLLAGASYGASDCASNAYLSLKETSRIGKSNASVSHGLARYHSEVIERHILKVRIHCHERSVLSFYCEMMPDLLEKRKGSIKLHVEAASSDIQKLIARTGESQRQIQELCRK